MRMASRVAFFLFVFLFGAAGVYWFTAYEPMGASLLFIASIAFGYISLVTRGAARRAERVAEGQQLAALAQAEEEVELHVLPTIWPFGFSLAAVALMIGLIVERWLLVVGAVLFVASAAGWFNDVRRQHEHPAGAPLEHGTEAAEGASESAGE
jgi:Cytochrome c oxidase subunit IV